MSFFDKLKQAINEPDKDPKQAAAETTTTTTIDKSVNTGGHDKAAEKTLVSKKDKNRNRKMKNFIHLVSAKEKKGHQTQKKRGVESARPVKAKQGVMSMKIKSKRRLSDKDELLKQNELNKKCVLKLKKTATGGNNEKHSTPVLAAALKKELTDKNEKSKDMKNTKSPKSHSEKHARPKKTADVVAEAPLNDTVQKPDNTVQKPENTIQKPDDTNEKPGVVYKKSVYMAAELREGIREEYFVDKYKTLFVTQKEPDSEASTKFEVLNVEARPAVSNNRRRKSMLIPKDLPEFIPVNTTSAAHGKDSAEVVEERNVLKKVPADVLPPVVTPPRVLPKKTQSVRNRKGEQSLKAIPKTRRESTGQKKTGASTPSGKKATISMKSKTNRKPQAVLKASSQPSTTPPPSCTSANSRTSGHEGNRSDPSPSGTSSDKTDKREKMKRDAQMKKSDGGGIIKFDRTQDDEEPAKKSKTKKK
ncbi:hypothetical protein QR680_006630 [Steinernema hermaphroditum]|uniref:Uncharacterized protein n=1 Tax=Steinernema hermaphroditum TaxID=289476 RepID=A0AA39HXI7_9BILA|nr:hypothetical protein QR680_006630 [Steinernema hermaphroditum]